MQSLKLHLETAGKKNVLTLFSHDSPIRKGDGQSGKKQKAKIDNYSS